MRDTAIRNTHPTVVTINGEIQAWDKDGNEVILDEVAIASEIQKLKDEWNKIEYQRLREKEYPSFADQFDILYHGGYDAWKAEIDKVKDKYPKQ